MFQSPNVQPQRLKEIQKSNLHVKNLIDSAKKMIYNQDNLSATEKQVLEVKISIEKDHLKNSFYKIDYPQKSVNLQIIDKNSQKLSSPFSKSIKFNETKNTFKFQTTKNYDQTNQSPYHQTKIIISRIVEKQQPQNITKIHNNSSSLRESQFSETYKAKQQTSRTYTIEEPQRKTKIVIKTSQEPYESENHYNTTQKHSNHQSIYKKDLKNSSFASSPQTQRFQFKEYSNVEPYRKQQINLFTAERTYQIKNTQTIENIDNQPYRIPLNQYMKETRKNDKFHDQYQKISQKSTSYKEILQKNKEKLQDSRQKHVQNGSISPSYKLDLQKLHDKRQQGKKRLYGQSYQSKSNEISNVSGGKVKYLIANSQRNINKTGNNLNSGNNTNREKSQTARSSRQSSSKQKSKELHSTIIKGIHLPCSSPCVKCKLKIKPPQQKQQPLSQYRLAKKYLTPQGEQQCYNFLRSQGIQEKDWPIFITEYVYRQLSKVYNQLSPKKAEQTN